jgi:hypothetical protein
MRIFICILFFVWGASTINAQITMDEVKQYFTEQSRLVKQAIEEKDYQKAEELDYAMIKAVLSYPEEIRKKINLIKGTLYYNIACYRSLANDKEKAVEAFAKAVENGWTNYMHSSKDADLNNIREEKGFIELMEKIRIESDFQNILKQAGNYSSKNGFLLPEFTYSPANDSDLVRVRNYFNLDSIAGNGDEISRIKNMLHWAHNVVRHDGRSMNPKSKNAIDLVEVCRKENRGINCRMIAVMLNECYLAMGFKSRYVICLPKKYVDDCHVINMVYSNTLNKWIWIDPTFNAYVMDEKGTLLGIAEVRERLISGAPLRINEDANWNNKKRETKEHYLDYYMTKNLYRMECVLHSGYNTETQIEGKPSPFTVMLYPSCAPEINDWQAGITDNAEYFWQPPDK